MYRGCLLNAHRHSSVNAQRELCKKVTPVGFEPTPFRNGALSHRLRPLGQSVIDAMFAVAFRISSWRAGALCAKFSPSHSPTANTFSFQVWHNQAFLCGVHKERRSSKMSTPGVEPGLSRPQRDVLTTRRCGLLCLAHPSDPGKDLASFQAGFLFVREWRCCRKACISDGISPGPPPADGGGQPLPCSLSGDVLSVGLVV